MPPKWLDLLTQKFNCRRILSTMVVTGFIMNAMLKSMFAMTIVSMAKPSNKSQIFEWSESQKQDLMGVFFWGFALTKIPSGRLAETVGSRNVMGYSMVFASILTVLTPVVAHWNYYALIVSRILMGALVGASWPAVMPLAAKWIPSKQHSEFMSCLTATTLGTGIVFYISGALIDSYGWESVFYVIGTITMLWSISWFYLVYDSPKLHPRISQTELELAESVIKTSKCERIKFRDVPWKEIGKSGPVWAITAAQIALFFGNTTLILEIPSYMDQVLHLDIEQNGIFSGLPYLGAYFASLFSGYVADALRKSKLCSTITVRKLFATTSLLIPAVCALGLGFWGYIPEVAITLFFLSITIGAVCTSGHCANILDISVNFSGTICGIVNTVASLGVYASTKLTAMILEKNHTFQEWRCLFWILFSVYVCCNFLYLWLASGEVQSWDSKVEKSLVCDEDELNVGTVITRLS